MCTQGNRLASLKTNLIHEKTVEKGTKPVGYWLDSRYVLTRVFFSFVSIDDCYWIVERKQSPQFRLKTPVPLIDSVPVYLAAHPMISKQYTFEI